MKEKQFESNRVACERDGDQEENQTGHEKQDGDEVNEDEVDDEEVTEEDEERDSGETTEEEDPYDEDGEEMNSSEKNAVIKKCKNLILRIIQKTILLKLTVMILVVALTCLHSLTQKRKSLLKTIAHHWGW